ncbi:hypothetical protein CSIM01_04566 [Colletotrichum simmondsii]|uniref:Ankyrin repeat protein n=1 Tax=Colletotrichum simmondsii TaxID=703756 RepID=A0A135SQB5_9PEZI|nr:hypothetical protein CSIM01_04566 [Colletotrichum simmondsii]
MDERTPDGARSDTEGSASESVPTDANRTPKLEDIPVFITKFELPPKPADGGLGPPGKSTWETELANLSTIHGAERDNQSTTHRWFDYIQRRNEEHFENEDFNNEGSINKDFNETNHIRRTLDQFYYSSLKDTISRDATQTVTKFTGSRILDSGMNLDQWSPGFRTHSFWNSPSAPHDSLVVMVDQLWIWAIDEHTIVSCYPVGDVANPPASWSSALNDVMLVPDPAKEATIFELCGDTIDLVASLVAHSVKTIFEGKNLEFADMLSIYRRAISTKAAQHTILLEEFSKDQLRMEAETPSDGKEELKLALDIIDILDELNILKYLLETQSTVLRSFQQRLGVIKPRTVDPASGSLPNTVFNMSSCKIEMIRLENTSFQYDVSSTCLLGGYGGTVIDEAIERVNQELLNVQRLCSAAERTQKMVLELLDLKQKVASLKETRETTKQGRAVMLFTIVTIIFLPLSFFTSYFGQNVVEFTGDASNPTANEVWKIGG